MKNADKKLPRKIAPLHAGFPGNIQENRVSTHKRGRQDEGAKGDYRLQRDIYGMTINADFDAG